MEEEGIILQDTTFSGDVSDHFVTDITTGFDSVDQGLMYIKGGIKKKRTVPTIEVKNFIQGYTPNPEHGGKVTVDKRVLDPQDFMGYLKFNPRDFEDHWWAVEQTEDLLERELPHTAEAAIVDAVISNNRAYMDHVVWRSVYDETAVAAAIENGLGDGDDNLIFIDGLIKKMFDDSKVNKVASPAALTASNIVSKFDATAAEVESKYYNHADFKWIINDATWKLYSQAQKNQSNKGVDFTKGGDKEFDGKPIHIVSGMYSDTIVGTLANGDITGNLWGGAHRSNEFENVMLKKYRPEKEDWFLKALFQFDVNYGMAKKIALYTTQTFGA